MTDRTDPTDAAADRGPFDATLRATLFSVAGCGAALTLGALLLLDRAAGLSTGIGAALAVGNLWALARIVTALLPARDADRDQPREARRSNGAVGWTVLALLKMLALFSVVWLLMRHFAVSPLPMLLGFAALPLGIAIGSVVSDRGVPGER
jgi:hypothetical protein